MPGILDPAVYDAWLDPSTPVSEVQTLLHKNLGPQIQFNRVSRAVNQAKFKGAECIEPVNPL